MHRAAVIFLFFAGSALAHPNHGGGSPLVAGLVHLLSEPDHLALLLLPLLGVGVLIRVLRRRAQHAKSKPLI